jgi:16S rRNA processing protein RimM
MSSDDSLVAIGKIVRPHGIQGELRVLLFNPDSEILDIVEEVHVKVADGPDRVIHIDDCRPVAGGGVLLVLEGIEDRNGADTLRGAILSVPRSSLPAPEEGEFYVHDIIGAVAVLADGTEIGKVIEHLSYPTTEVLVIQGASRRYEVPLVRDFVQSVDPAAKRVVLTSVDGFESE